ncbi:MAG: DUF1573 domain-containing protein [Bacteroidales bacterium]|nr:DUF1573 domain-containing protein [Bacteroidales bacterium]
MRRIIVAILICSAYMIPYMPAGAQEKISENLEIDHTIHDFGEIMIEDGPVSCSFIVRNTGEKPAVIYNVVSSCGCTDVKWTREPLRPGQSGKIDVTYSNDEGAYPFDKNLTVYFSDVKRPVILKVRGVSVEKKKPLDEVYKIRYGSLGLKEASLKCGNMEQGGSRTELTYVANLSDKPIDVDFQDVSDHLEISVSPNPIPAGSTAQMTYKLTASRDLWGKQWYDATPVVNGKAFLNDEGKPISIWGFTKENFDNLTHEEKQRGPRPTFENSTYSFGKIRQGETIHAEFSFRNDGKECFCVYKVDINAPKWSHSKIKAAAQGEEVGFRVHLDTNSLPKGETLAIVTLTTNSPLRPIVNLFIAGWIE